MNDPYFSTQNCINRLYCEYTKHKQLIVAVDFDDTIYPYHQTGNTHYQVIDLLRKCQNLDFYIVVFTGCAPDKFGFIQKFFEDLNIKLDSINKNPIDLPFGNHGKIYYNILLDDRAGLWQAYETLSETIKLIESK